MKALLAVTAVIELGPAWCCWPARRWPSSCCSVRLSDALAAVALGRVAGAVLLALGVACWLARGDEPSRAAKGLVGAMVLYNLGVVVVLGSAGMQWKAVGIALWPAVALHSAMTTWCIACLRSEIRKSS